MVGTSSSKAWSWRENGFSSAFGRKWTTGRTYLRKFRRSFLRRKVRGGGAKKPNSLRNPFVTPSKPHRNSFVATRSLRQSSTLPPRVQLAGDGEETGALRNSKAEGRNNRRYWRPTSPGGSVLVCKGRLRP